MAARRLLYAFHTLGPSSTAAVCLSPVKVDVQRAVSVARVPNLHPGQGVRQAEDVLAVANVHDQFVGRGARELDLALRHGQGELQGVAIRCFLNALLWPGVQPLGGIVLG